MLALVDGTMGIAVRWWDRRREYWDLARRCTDAYGLI
jgi:hypothetical protein